MRTEAARMMAGATVFGALACAHPSARYSPRAHPVDIPRASVPPAAGNVATEAGASEAQELEREIAWARSQWPTELSGVQFHSLAPKLYAWVPRGAEVRAYLLGANWRCTPVDLSYFEHESGPEDGAGEPRGNERQPVLIGRIITSERNKGGARERLITHAEFGPQLTLYSGGGVERLDSSGKWVEQGLSSGAGDPPDNLGVLSSVDDQVARFGGRYVTPLTSCDGPYERIACRGGGEQSCDRCERLSVRVEYGRPGFATLVGLGSLGPNPCPSECPSHAPPRRLEDLFKKARAWKLLEADDFPNSDPSSAPRLYRASSRCQQDQH